MMRNMRTILLLSATFVIYTKGVGDIIDAVNTGKLSCYKMSEVYCAQHPGEKFAHHSVCKKYFECHITGNGEPIERTCGNKKLFNPETKSCEENMIKTKCCHEKKAEERITLDIMQRHLSNSLNYLYTGVQYDSQYLERPGLAKKLRDMSDAHWEAGMAALNKFIEHGGVTNDAFVQKLHFEGTDMSKGKIYLDTFKTLKDDSESLLQEYQTGYHRFWTNGNADMAHYLEEKIEKEVKHLHELKGHLTTLDVMDGIGVGVAAFDSNL